MSRWEFAALAERLWGRAQVVVPAFNPVGCRSVVQMWRCSQDLPPSPSPCVLCLRHNKSKERERQRWWWRLSRADSHAASLTNTLDSINGETEEGWEHEGKTDREKDGRTDGCALTAWVTRVWSTATLQTRRLFGTVIETQNNTGHQAFHVSLTSLPRLCDPSRAEHLTQVHPVHVWSVMRVNWYVHARAIMCVCSDELCALIKHIWPCVLHAINCALFHALLWHLHILWSAAYGSQCFWSCVALQCALTLHHLSYCTVYCRYAQSLTL